MREHSQKIHTTYNPLQPTYVGYKVLIFLVSVFPCVAVTKSQSFSSTFGLITNKLFSHCKYCLLDYTIKMHEIDPLW